MNKRILVAFIAAFSITPVLTVRASAYGMKWISDIDPVLQGLQGLGGVKVTVADVPQELAKLGLSAKQIQADAEARLRQEGIAVYPHTTPEEAISEVWRSEGEPTLVIAPQPKPTNHEPDKNWAEYSIVVRLEQKVTLMRQAAAVMSAPTWQTCSVSGPGGTAEELHQQVRDLLEQFVAAYNRANPIGTSREIPLPETNAFSSPFPSNGSRPTLWKTTGVGREPLVTATDNGGETLALSAAPADFPYAYQYGGITRAIAVNLKRYPVLVAYVNRMQTGSYAHLDVEAHDAKGQLLQARSVPTLQKPGLTFVDLGEQWEEKPDFLNLRLIVGGTLSGASCDYAWVRFISRADLTQLQAQSQDGQLLNYWQPYLGLE